MKKIILNIIFIFLNFIMIQNVSATSTIEATESIDITRNGSFTLHYSYDNYSLEHINVRVYDIASVSSDFQYQLSSNFSTIPVEINGLTTNEEWIAVKETIQAYIIADSIQEDMFYANQNDVIEISNLTPGLYLVQTDKILIQNHTLLFDSFLVSVPNLSVNGKWDYDIDIYPKAEESLPQYEEITYTVMKQWFDNEINRPNCIEIEIYKDGLFVERQVLCDSNQWLYQWQAVDDGSEWSVVERNIPKYYKVTILKNEENFIIVNKDSTYQEENPETYDAMNGYFYLVVGSFIGLILLTICLMRQKKSEK